MLKRPVVSVVCEVSDSVFLVRRAIESVLKQHTKFHLELLLFGEMTDEVREVVHSLMRKTPGVIRVCPDEWLNFQMVRGKYVAFCEHHAYFLDPYKLQKQYDYLEETKSCVLSCHAVQNTDRGHLWQIIALSKRNRFIFKEQLLSDAKLFVPLSGMMVKSQYVRYLPSMIRQAPNVARAVLLYASLKGKVYFMRDVMVEGYWDDWQNDDENWQKAFCDEYDVDRKANHLRPLLLKYIPDFRKLINKS